MNITDVRIKKLDEPLGKLLAIVSITVDDCFVIHDLKIIQGENRLFIAMPSRKNAEGEYKDIAHPINIETRRELRRIILDAYEKIE